MYSYLLFLPEYDDQDQQGEDRDVQSRKDSRCQIMHGDVMASRVQADSRKGKVRLLRADLLPVVIDRPSRRVRNGGEQVAILFHGHIAGTGVHPCPGVGHGIVQGMNVPADAFVASLQKIHVVDCIGAGCVEADPDFAEGSGESSDVQEIVLLAGVFGVVGCVAVQLRAPSVDGILMVHLLHGDPVALHAAVLKVQIFEREVNLSAVVLRGDGIVQNQVDIGVRSVYRNHIAGLSGALLQYLCQFHAVPGLDAVIHDAGVQRQLIGGDGVLRDGRVGHDCLHQCLLTLQGREGQISLLCDAVLEYVKQGVLFGWRVGIESGAGFLRRIGKSDRELVCAGAGEVMVYAEQCQKLASLIESGVGEGRWTAGEGDAVMEIVDVLVIDGSGEISAAHPVEPLGIPQAARPVGVESGAVREIEAVEHGETALLRHPVVRLTACHLVCEDVLPPDRHAAHNYGGQADHDNRKNSGCPPP